MHTKECLSEKLKNAERTIDVVAEVMGLEDCEYCNGRLFLDGMPCICLRKEAAKIEEEEK